MANEITAWSPSAVPDDRAVWKAGKTITRLPLPADTWGQYSPRKGRISHAGIVFVWPETGNYFLSFEGNVGVGGGKQGITILRRKKSDVHIVCEWIDDEVVRSKVVEATAEMNELPIEEINKANADPEHPDYDKEIIAVFFVALMLMKFGNEG